MNDQVLDEFARAIDDRVLALPPGCDPARLFGVRLRGDNDFVLLPFWSGVAREIPQRLMPPEACVAIVLDGGGWTAPLNDDGSADVRASLHPRRRRVHQTCVLTGDAGTDVTVLRQENDPPQVLRGGVGVVLDLLRACWSNRREVA
ncbi:MAG: hypothetical protein SGJ13_00935 [Actinomycetota bacterium]|nr:hypothetical protein [Actinomycetota bacterium]